MSNSRSPRAVRSMTIGIRGMRRTLRNEDGGALEGAVAEVAQRLLGRLERIGGDGRADRHAGSKLQKLEPVLPRQIGHAADLALQPQIVVGERGYLAHVDPGADDGAAAIEGPERGGDELADGGEDQCRVERLGWVVG